MRRNRLLLFPLLMLFAMACGLSNGIQQLQQAVTQLPGALTSMPAVETSAAGASANCPSTPTAGGLDVTLYQTKTVLQTTGQFTFTDSTSGGKPVSTATLSTSAAANFPTIAGGFSAQFIGDPCNLSEIIVTVPRTDQQVSVDEALGLANVLFASFLPPDVMLGLLTWMTQNYKDIQVGGQQQTTFGKFQFTLKRDQTNMVLDILPSK